MLFQHHLVMKLKQNTKSFFQIWETSRQNETRN